MSDSNAVNEEDFESCELNNIVECKDADCDTLQVEQQISKTDNSQDPRSQLRQIIKCKMYVFFRELWFLFLLVLTYAAFQNNTPKTSKSPNAFRFFPAGSIVRDWYHGQLSEAIEIASESDLAFVMYYAPWDAESQAVRYEFDLAAQHLHSQIHFAAINCWQPGSECRQQYNKVYSWPVLMAYPAHGRGIQFRGPKKAEHMIRFLQSVSNPLIRINSILDVVKYQAVHDAVLVGFVDPTLGSPDYGTFYTAALRFLERDPFREVAFLICTFVPDVYLYRDISFPALQLYLWNETLIYSKLNEWKPDLLVSWISDSLHQVSVWASPPGGKSLSLSSYIQPGPALILFTPRNPLYNQVDYYNALHSVALDYYNCQGMTEELFQKYLFWAVRKEYKKETMDLKAKCLIPKTNNKKKFPTVVTYDHKIWLNNTCDNKNLKQQSVCSKMNKVKLNKDTCSNVEYVTKTVLNEFYKSTETPLNSNLPSIPIKVFSMEEMDPRSPKNLLRLEQSEKCHFFRMAHGIHPPSFAPLNLSEEENSATRGLACKTNASLSMVSIDSLQYHYIAEGLGIDILNIEDKSAVVILNPTMETHHVMKTPISVTNLKTFITDFTNGLLERTLSSVVADRQFVHSYESNSCKNKTEKICVQELNTHSFLPTIMQPNMAVVVMYYSPKCAFCSGVSYTLLATAKLLSSVNDLLFARIDGDSNELPWEFAMHHYPSILFFPARRKSESRAFTQNVPITVTNIISFILANADSHLRIRVMWTICKQATYNNDELQCLRTIRTETITLIGRLLRGYRISTDVQQRTGLLKQLQHLRSLLFLLESPLDFSAIDHHINLLRYVHLVPKKNKRHGVL